MYTELETALVSTSCLMTAEITIHQRFIVKRIFTLLHPFLCSKSTRQALLVMGVLCRLSASAQIPYLLPTNPLRNAIAASVTGPFPLAFSSAIAPASVSAIRLIGSQGLGRRAATTTVVGGSVSLALSGRFLAGEPVTLSVPNSVQGTNGQAVQAQTLQFITAVSGTGRGTFSPGPDVPLAMGTGNHTLADIDADGDLDLLIPQTQYAGYVTGTVAVRLNDGRGNFSGTTTVSTARAPYALAAADVDGDGDQDLLAACSPSNVVSVRLNDGRGNFSGGSDVPVVTTAYQLTTGDLDGDGDLDLVVHTNTAGQTVASIRLNQGNGTFAGGSEIAVQGGTGALTLGDIDSDGDLDLLAGCARSNTVETRLNNGQGQFAATGSSIAVGNYPQELRLTDIDSDGDLDLLTLNIYGSNISIRFNTRGTFGGGSDIALRASNNINGLVVGDLDSDNDVDFVVVVNDTRPFIRVEFNQGPVIVPCTAADTTATISPAGVVTTGCGGQVSTTLRVTSGVSSGAVYEWQFAPAGSGTWQVLTGGSLPEYQATQPGRYRVKIAQRQCIATSPATEVRQVLPQTTLVPNVFTPNGDQVNEVFELQLNSPRTFELQIYNRWGKQVFSSNQYGHFWTGAGASPGLYFYHGRYTTECDAAEQVLKGTVTLVR